MSFHLFLSSMQLFSHYHKYLKVTSHIYHSSIFLLDNPLFFPSNLPSSICRCDKPLEPLSTCPAYSNFLFIISFVKCNSVCNSVCTRIMTFLLDTLSLQLIPSIIL